MSHINQHLHQKNTSPAAIIPKPLAAPAFFPQTTQLQAEPRFDITVNQAPLKELAFTLAHEAKLNLDIDPSIDQLTSFQAHQQTAREALQRLAKQNDLRLEQEGESLRLVFDHPYLHHYQINYVNISRQIHGAISSNAQIGTTLPGNSNISQQNGNLSNTRIESQTQHHFWETLEKNIQEILLESDKALPTGSIDTETEQNNQQSNSGPTLQGETRLRSTKNRASGTSNSNQPLLSQQNNTAHIKRRTFKESTPVIIHPETGQITIRATQRQHEKISEFLRHVESAAQRQVMIEATIVEVQLSNGYRQGIDWSLLSKSNAGISVTRPSTGSVDQNGNAAFNLTLKGNGSPLNMAAAVDLLESFGTTRVLSSPRLSALNNQTALLKVVDNIVYFNVKSDTTTSANVGTSTAVTTTPQSVSVGLILAVTPQISEFGEVMLNVRPTISSVSGWKQDPNPSNKVANFVPQIRTREIESIMKIPHGDIAVLGGLMEDSSDYQTGRLPLLGEIPMAGELVTKRDNQSRKSELVIFLRPWVARPSNPLPVTGLPGEHFFKPPQEGL